MLTREIRIGLTVLLGLVLVYLTIAWARRIHLFAPEVTTYQIRFGTVDGLMKGDVVSMRGYPAGRVTGISPQHDFVMVDIALDRSISLYQDAQAEIQIKEIMGGKQVSLLPGNEPPALAAGEVIKGQTSLDFASSFSQVGKLLGKIDRQTLDETAARLDRISRQLEAILLNVDPRATGRIIQNLERSTTRLDELTRPLEAQRIDGTWRRVDSLLAHADAGLLHIDSLARVAERSTLPRADSLLDQMSQTLSLVNGLAQDAQELSELLQDEETLPGQILHDRSLPQRVDSLLMNLNATLRQIQERKIIVGFRLKDKK